MASAANADAAAASVADPVNAGAGTIPAAVQGPGFMELPFDAGRFETRLLEVDVAELAAAAPPARQVCRVQPVIHSHCLIHAELYPIPIRTLTTIC